MKTKTFILGAVLVGLAAVNSTAQTIIDQGYCGKYGSNLTWTFSSDSVLRIYGSGDMENYPNSLSTYAPWIPNYFLQIKTIIIGNNVTSIGNQVFQACTNLIAITIPNSVTSIGNYAFYNCFSLASITIPNSVTYIGNHAFYNCWLTSVTIPNSVTYIGSYAFSGCGFTSISIPNSVTSIGSYAFEGCGRLISVTIPNSITSIETAVFRDCGRLTSVTIPNSVTSIGNYAFYNCFSLASITIPNSVTTLGNFVFYRCYNLTSVTIPNSVTTLGDGAFSNCSNLTSVTIGNSVTTIESYTFEKCINLSSLIIHAVTPPVLSVYLGEHAFSNVSDTLPVYVPCGFVATYQNTAIWSYFNNYIGFTDTTFIFDTICYGTVYNDNGFDIPAAVTEVYHRTIPSVDDCDSTICLTFVLHLPSVPTNYSASICQGETYTDNHFTNLTQSGTYYDTLQTINGCDSLIELTLVVHIPPVPTNYSATICEGKTYTDNNFTNLTQSGIYYNTLHTIYGCDSLIELTLIVNPTYITQISDSISVGDSYNFFGKLLTSDGVYFETLQTIHGCDSIIVLTLIVTGVGIVPITNYELRITNYEIYNIVGQLLLSIKSLPSCQQTIEVLPAGIYIIRMQTNKGTITKKIIKSSNGLYSPLK